MRNFLLDCFIWLIPLAVGFYTLTYAKWLWQKNFRFGACGIGVLALLAALYPGYVLFFIHQ